MTIRPLKPEDADAVERIYDLYWDGGFRENLSKKLKRFINKDPEIMSRDYRYFVAEDANEVVGVAIFRKLPDHMKQFATTANPVEFYILAVKYKGKGIGTALRSTRIEEAKKLGYTEIIFFSAESHSDSWKFHDKSDFKRISEAVAPNGEKGYIWRMELKNK